MDTPVSLLERMRIPGDARAWERFVRLYTPLLLRWFAMKKCPYEESLDLVQEVFVSLVKVLPQFVYDKNKGFGRWLRTVAVNKWRDRVKRRQLPMPPQDNFLDQVAAEVDEPFWLQEHRADLARRALELMRTDFPGNTWLACWQVVAEGIPVSEVANSLGMTEGAVRAARFRVLTRLRRELAGLVD